MKKHTKVYMDFFDYCQDDKILCEMECGSVATDIHHLERRGMGAGKNSQRNHIENLMALCRDCHIKAESDGMFNMFARIKHLEGVCHQIWALIEYEKRFKKNANRN
tara:strand:+ start:698 stop:1015 length:318 start_codon:yes stop_codon:yes gene_type:complete